jgi:hypothetical protein
VDLELPQLVRLVLANSSHLELEVLEIFVKVNHMHEFSEMKELDRSE